MAGSNSASQSFSVLQGIKSQILGQLDLFGSVVKSKKSLIEDINRSLDQLAKGEGRITLSSGVTVEAGTPTGMAVFTAHLQFLQGISEFVDESFGFVRNFEKSLDSISAG